MTAEADRARWVERLREQSRSAAGLGSPMVEVLLAGVADDLEADGPCARVLAPHLGDATSSALGLRLLAAVHRLVLRRRVPALALHYPSVGGEAPPTEAWPAFRDAVEAHGVELADLTALPCQTNEVGRSAALVVGYLHALADAAPDAGLDATELPLHHLELGSSAGLNLRWDRFAYGHHGTGSGWGDPASPVDLTGHWADVPLDGLPRSVTVVGRSGCDPRPGDPADAETREGLTAAIWPDQRARHARLKVAIALAGEVEASVDRANAAPWLADRLAARPDGLTVVSHSVVWRYVDPTERLQIRRLLTDHRATATAARPLAWVRLEPQYPRTTYDGSPYAVTVTRWPGPTHRVVAVAQAHGQEVRRVA